MKPVWVSGVGRSYGDWTSPGRAFPGWLFKYNLSIPQLRYHEKKRCHNYDAGD